MSTHNNTDYITVLTANQPVNKHYSIFKGRVIKETPRYCDVIAKTVHVPTLADLLSVLESVSENENQYIILGFIRDSTEYTITTAKRMEATFGHEGKGLHKGKDGKYHAARIKDNFTQSSYTMFDDDEVSGMPDHLIYDNSDDWLNKMGDWIPSLKDAAHIRTESNSARVLHNGIPFAKNNAHVYVKVKDAADVDRFGKAALIQSFSHEAGFMRPIFSRTTGKQIGQRPWTMFDSAVFSRERIDYAGKPSVHDPNLTVATKRFDYHEGGLLDTALMLSPTKEQSEATGLELSKNSTGGWGLTDNRSLTPDIVIETQDHGSMTVQEYKDSGLGKLRCQSPFRPDSSSWAAYISRHKDGTPFLYDVGTQTKYLLHDLAAMFGEPPDFCLSPPALTSDFKSDYGAANYLTQTLIHSLRYSAPFWYQIKNKTWHKIKKEIAQKLIQEELVIILPELSTHKLVQVTTMLKLLLGGIEWVTDSNLIPLKNGVLNAKERILYDYKDYYFNWQLPYDYDALKTCPSVMQWLDDVLEFKDDIKIIRAAMKVALLGGDVQVFLEVTGAGGLANLH